MSGSYEVVTDALTNHARTLSGLAGELRAVQDMTAGVSVTAEAYGVVGGRFASAIEALARVGQDTLREGVDGLESAATDMRRTVATYDQQEAEGVDRFTNLDDVLDQPGSDTPPATAGGQS